MLNLYKYMTPEKMNNFIKTKDEILSSTAELNPIDVMEVNEFYSLSEIEKISNRLYTGSNFKSLFSLLENLSKEERGKKITEYNLLVEEYIDKKNERKKVLDFAVSANLDSAGLFIPFLGTGIKILDFTLSKLNLKSINKIEKIREAFLKFNKENINDKKVVSFLAKVNPVARLRYSDDLF